MASAKAAVRLVPVDVPGPAGRLEGLLQIPDPASGRIALVCHPHPLYGGTLHNKVVHRVAATMVARGATVLRFNFRGVGKSEGTSVGGKDEIEDARAAWTWLTGQHPGVQGWLAGFSFGSWVAASVAPAASQVEALVLVAPPVTRSGFEVMRESKVPKLVVQGTADTVCSPEALRREFPLWSEPKRLREVEGATHFFDKRLGDLAQALEELLPGPA